MTIRRRRRVGDDDMFKMCLIDTKCVLIKWVKKINKEVLTLLHTITRLNHSLCLY